jgi:hypothetical protein
MQRFASKTFVLILCRLVVACQAPTHSRYGALSTFSDSQIIGVWQANYSLADSVEILELNENKSYVQIFENSTGYLYVKTDGSWATQKSDGGRVLLHLSGGLWFPLGPKTAQLKGMDSDLPDTLHAFYDPKTNRTFTMSDELILDIIPWNNSKGFNLFQFPYEIDLAPDHFEPLIR